MNFSVVRGADRELGKAIAIALSEMGRNLILIGKKSDTLKRLSEYIVGTSHVGLFYFDSDDTVTANIVKICNQINDRCQIDLLVNYNETDFRKKFDDFDIFGLDRELKINYVAAPIYVHQLMPNLMQQENTYVLNLHTFYPESSGWRNVVGALNRNFTEYLQTEMVQSDSPLKVCNMEIEYSDNNPEILTETSHLETARKILDLLFKSHATELSF